MSTPAIPAGRISGSATTIGRTSPAIRRCRSPTATRPDGSTRAPSRCRRSGRFGNSGRNTLEGPGYRNVGLAVFKLIPLGGARLQARFEVFNLLNTTNFDLPDAFLGSPTFGQILSAGSPRQDAAGSAGVVLGRAVSRCSRCDRVHGACGAGGLRPHDETTTRRKPCESLRRTATRRRRRALRAVQE